jgi:cyanobactin maturation PatA/PatG family protease
VSSLASYSRGNGSGTLPGLQPGFDSLPGLTALWADTKGDPAICVAILDAPVGRTNPCLQSARIEEHWLGYQPHCAAHGTEVASVIFAPHETGVFGIAPGCRGISVPIYDCDPERSPSTNQRQLARATHDALAAGAHIINVSAGQLVPAASAEPELAEAVQACAAAGVLIVAAAGNDGCDCLHVPAALPCVLAVGAMRWDGTPLPGSNWGSIYTAQGLLAPGEDIPVAGRQGPTELRTGTSFATAVVSGVAALLLSRERKNGRPVRPLLIRKALLAAARSVRHTGNDSHRFLAGRLDITEAMHLLDTWSNTMTHEDLDFAVACNAPSDNGGDPHPTLVKPSSEPVASPPQPSQMHQSADREPRRAESVDAVQPSACAACRGERQLVYALGQIGYDFGSEAGMDAFRQRMGTGSSPLDEVQMASFLAKSSYDATGLLWTLSVEGLPIYVIRPEGPFARDAYQQMMNFLSHKHDPNPTKRSERIAVAGVITGQARLFNGQQVPVVDPDLRGLSNWNTGALIDNVIAAVIDDKNDALVKEGKPKLTAAQKATLTGQLQTKLGGFVPEFLFRIYHELRNVGRTPRERALNYAGTNLFEFVKIVLSKMLSSDHSLDAIDAVPSALCRPGSDCWDVTLAFFDSSQPITNVRWHHRYTIDVSEVIPVTVGEVRSWKAR